MTHPSKASTEGTGDQWHGHRIGELWVLVAVNEMGDEGIIGIEGPNGQTMPAIVSDPELKEKVTEAIDFNHPAVADQKVVWRHFIPGEGDEVVDGSA